MTIIKNYNIGSYFMSNILLHTILLRNIKLYYKTDEKWLQTMKYAFEVYERLNIQPYVRK